MKLGAPVPPDQMVIINSAGSICKEPPGGLAVEGAAGSKDERRRRIH